MGRIHQIRQSVNVSKSVIFMDNIERLAINNLYGKTGVVKFQAQVYGRFITRITMLTMSPYLIARFYVGTAIS